MGGPGSAALATNVSRTACGDTEAAAGQGTSRQRAPRVRAHHRRRALCAGLHPHCQLCFCSASPSFLLSCLPTSPAFLPLLPSCLSCLSCLPASPAFLTPDVRMAERRNLLSVIAAVAFAASTVAVAASLGVLGSHGPAELAKLGASDGANGAWFGGALARDGDLVVVGAFAGAPNGAAYVFQCSGACTQQAKITHPEPADSFARSVAVIPGTGVVIACSHHVTISGRVNQGACYVYQCTRAATPWSCAFLSRFVASDGGANDVFGIDSAASGTVVAISASGATVGGRASQGAVYLFDCAAATTTGCVQRVKLTASDGGSGDIFAPMALAGGVVGVGAPRADVGGRTDQGAAYIFECSYDALPWTCSQRAKLLASDGAARDELGVDVAIAGELVAVAAGLTAVDGAANHGAAYLYQCATGWSSCVQVAKIGAVDNSGGSVAYLTQVALHGRVLYSTFRGASVNGFANHGALFVHGCDDSAVPWACVQRTRLLHSSGKAGDNLGWALVVSPDQTVLVGAHAATGVTGASTAGAAFVFACDDNACDDCAALTGCDMCTASPTCGWCAASGMCLSGTATGPVAATCAPASWTWAGGRCPDIEGMRANLRGGGIKAGVGMGLKRGRHVQHSLRRRNWEALLPNSSGFADLNR